MVTRLIFITISSFIVLSCTHTRYIPVKKPEVNQTDYATMMQRSKTDVAKLVTYYDTFSASNILIFPDSTYFADSKTGDQKVIATKTVKEISFRDRGKGVLEGTGMGLLIGFSIGFPIGYFSYEEDQVTGLGSSKLESGVSGGIIFAIPTTAIGLIIGIARGSEDKYVFNQR